MTNKGFVVPAGGGTRFDMGAPGRFADVELVGHETNESVMMFEETLYTPASAGGYVEELMHRAGAPMNDKERLELRERYQWEVVGPNPL
jgi:hypothetical protein